MSDPLFDETDVPSTAPPSQTVPLSPPKPTDLPPATGPRAESRYQILRSHARGGLGEVFLARDQELQRNVAVKEIQASQADDPVSRNRFLLEAEITGSLEHPGIVPVYGLGRYADGRPFYAMRFIQGETLRDAVRRFHEADAPGRDAGERSLALRQLLTQFIAVCKTVAYAHSRGVLHRDLKPSNILLGKYGETLVVDWGLAKATGSQSEEARDDAEMTFRPSLGDPQATQAGQTFGTPTYMSPEQAAGETDRLGPASDIYSLGATLYAILTGQAPFPGTDKYAIMEKVRQGECQPPRTVKPNVPAPLEAVCQKAMALAPAERYATALELAADVEHWLADEPVSAWREPLFVRLGRWKRRHRAGVQVGIAAVFVIILLLSVATVLLKRANDAAQHRYKVSGAILNRFTAEIIGKRRLLTLDPKLLEDVVSFYEELAEEEAGDQAAKAERGKVYLLLAELHYYLGHNDKALDAAENANKLFIELDAARPRETLFERGRARSYYMLGRLHLDGAHFRESDQAWHEAMPIQERLAKADSDEACKPELAQTYAEWGLSFYDRGRYDDAQNAQNKALAIRKSLADWQLPDSQRDLAESHSYLGNLWRVSGRYDEALAAFQAAMDIARKLEQADRDDPTYRLALASSYYGMGLTHLAAGRAKEAEDNLRQALTMQRELDRKHHKAVDYPESLARTLNALGAVYRESGRADEAATVNQEALGLSKALAEHPGTPWYPFLEARVCQHLGIAQRERGRLNDAEAAYNQALRDCSTLVKKHPEHVTFATNLGYMYGTQGDLLRDQGKPREALASYDEASKALQGVLQKESRHVEAREYECLARVGRAVALAQSGDRAEADKALPQIPEGSPGRLVREICLGRALVWAHAGKYVSAAKEADKLVAMDKSSLSGRMLYELACVRAVCAAEAARDNKLAPAERKKRAEDNLDCALKLLGDARQAHYFHTDGTVNRLQKDPTLSAVRSRPSYQQLEREVQANAKAAAQ